MVMERPGKGGDGPPKGHQGPAQFGVFFGTPRSSPRAKWLFIKTANEQLGSLVPSVCELFGVFVGGLFPSDLIQDSHFEGPGIVTSCSNYSDRAHLAIDHRPDLVLSNSFWWM